MKKFGLTFKFPSSIIFVGARKSGKSCMVKQLLIQKKGILENHDYAFVFTLGVNREFFENFIKPEHIFSGLNTEWLEKLKNIQEKIKNAGKPLPRVCIILDDLLSDRKQRNSCYVESLYSTCRHFNMTIVALAQSASYMKPIIRQSEFIFLFPSSIFLRSDKQFLFDDILSNFKLDREACEKLFEKSPLYLAIVVDQYSNTRELQWFMSSKKMIQY